MMLSRPGQGWTKPGQFQLAKGKTLAIPMELHNAARKKLTDYFLAKGVRSGVILLQGGEQQNQYDTDTELVFRQDSWFNYLFGVREPGIYGAISLPSGKSTLFIPKLPEDYRIWCGTIHPPSHFQLSYAVDEVLYTEDLFNWLQANSMGASVHVMSGTNSDSGTEMKPPVITNSNSNSNSNSGIELQYDTTILYYGLSLCRVTKSPEEAVAMRYSAYVASNAHVEVMRSVSNCNYEYELEAKFMYEIYKNGGCRKAAYTAICACGPNNAVLHYGHAGAPNDRELLPTDMALLDMGAEYHGYVSDITCSFPISGKFTADQKAVYMGVLNAQKVVMDAIKPGFSWIECHRLAEREVLTALLGMEILQNGSIDDFMACSMGAIFMPHGLGHLIGCDTHDVGGYIEGAPSRHSAPGVNKLRTARVLEANMVLTNEPGCYFIDALIDKALADATQSKYINTDKINQYRGFGGVRLEDVVMVTTNSVINFTTCPRTIEEVESVLAGGAWPPAKDEAPYLRRQWTKLSADCSTMDDIILN